MQNTDLTIPYVHNETLLSLGGSAVNVEISEGDIQMLIASAVRVYNTYLPQHSFSSLAVTEAVKRYAITHTNLIGVVNVEFTDPNLANASADPFSPLYYNVGGGNSVGNAALNLAALEDARRVFSTDPEWRGMWDGSNYYLYIDIHMTLTCSYEYTWAINTQGVAIAGDPVYGVANYGDYGLKHIKPTDVQWFLDYISARAKMVVGRIRSKFGGVPTPDGGTDQTDGDNLINEGREAVKELEDAIRKRRAPIPAVIG